MPNSPGKRQLHRADYSSIADWDRRFKAAVAESIAFNALREGLKRDPGMWSATSMEFKTAAPASRHIYDRYYDDLEEGTSRWRPDGFFYSKERAGDYPAHIILQEVKTGESVPDIRDSQYERMKEYAQRSRSTVYYSFVQFTDDEFDLSMLQLVPDGPDGFEWFYPARPPDTSRRTVSEIQREQQRKEEQERELWAAYAGPSVNQDGSDWPDSQGFITHR